MRFLHLAMLTVFTLSCASKEEVAVVPAPPLQINLVKGSELAEGGVDVDALLSVLQKDLRSRDTAGRLEFTPKAALNITFHQVAPSEITAGGFRLQGSAGAYIVSASDALGIQYGAYELLERAGLLFHHPEETVFPRQLCLACIGTVDELIEPTYTMRGTHVHTLHPLEYESTLLGHAPATLPRYEKLLGWLIARRQNFIEWNLLRTINHELWLKHATKLVELSHARGFQIGIVAPIAFRQQNSYFLYDGESATPATEQIAKSVDWLMQAGWDRIHVEMGASEFLSIPDTDQVGWLNFLAEYLGERYPGTGTATKVHCTVNQTAPSYGNMNFNYIVQFADARMAIMPHTVQFYDLYRVGPTYDREDFFDMREFLLQEIGKRKVFYYPETAYWVTFDSDVPLFLPQYIYARWNDLYRLRDTGMDGQINFSSGFEWGYWMNDFSAAWHAYKPDADYAAPLKRIFGTFGGAAAGALATFDEIVKWQGTELLEKNGIRWLVAWDAADDLGHFADIHGQPVAVRLYELAKMSPADVKKFESTKLKQLAAMADSIEAQAAAWAALAPNVAPEGRRIYNEIRIGMDATAIRARFMLTLYESTAATAKGDSTQGDALLAQAKSLRDKGIRVVARQEAIYRFPFNEIAVDRFSLTSYPFGYLRTVPDLWYWEREIDMVTDPKGYKFMVALYDLIESGGF